MSGEQPMPAAGKDGAQGAADGVNAPAQRGRTAGGESGGSGYAEGGPRTAGGSGFMGHGGQSDLAYHGGGQAGAEGPRAGNATTRSEGDVVGGGEPGPKPGPSAPYQDRVAEQTRDEVLGGRTVEVFEESGVAAAELSGKTGVEGERRVDGEEPGSG